MISSLELAKLCGMSQGTVDRAIHNRPGISERTRQKILDLARRYGYQPNPAVREIMYRSSNLVGAIIPSLNNIFFMDMMSLLKESLKDQNKMLLLTPVKDWDDFIYALDEFAARKMHAAIVVPPEENLVLPDRITQSLPVLSLLSECKGKAIVHLSADEVQAGKMAVQYFAKLGHRRILHITYARQAQGILMRVQGYREQMRTLGLKPRVEIYHTEEDLLKTLKQYRPSAIFCHNDWLAFTILRFVQDQGLRVPEEISILGVDHTPTLQMLYPDLSSLEYPMKQFTRSINEWVATGKITIHPGAFKVIEGKTCMRRSKGTAVY